jgi:hypothetical protein
LAINLKGVFLCCKAVADSGEIGHRIRSKPAAFSD